ESAAAPPAASCAVVKVSTVDPGVFPPSPELPCWASRPRLGDESRRRQQHHRSVASLSTSAGRTVVKALCRHAAQSLHGREDRVCQGRPDASDAVRARPAAYPPAIAPTT